MSGATSFFFVFFSVLLCFSNSSDPLPTNSLGDYHMSSAKILDRYVFGAMYLISVGQRSKVLVSSEAATPEQAGEVTDEQCDNRCN